MNPFRPPVSRERELHLSCYRVLETGVDGGHRYITATIEHDGEQRSVAVMFASKADELSLRDGEPIRVVGTLRDDGPANSLMLLNARLAA